jgi:type II secretory pathway component GspD/PulD (secretin)
VSNRLTGITLTVTPRITPDGFVRMEVTPEVSSLSSSSVQISENLNSPIFNTRKAKTIVTVQDGHTIVIGGLISTKNDNRENKVPVIGDIPLLGLLFKSTTVVKERSELMIILTPRIIRNVDQSDRATNDELSRLNVTRKANNCTTLDALFNPLSPSPSGEPAPLRPRDVSSTRPSTGSLFFPEELRRIPPENGNGASGPGSPWTGRPSVGGG